MFEVVVPSHLKDKKTCIMPICGCIDAMHGKAFQRLVLAVSQKFDHVRLIMCDTLDAHNFAMPNEPLWPTAIDACVADAARWLKKSRPVLEASFKAVSVTYWDDLKSSDFDALSSKVNELYKNNDSIKNYINSICADYTERAVTRQKAQGFIPDEKRIFARSLNYTLEEIPGTVIYNRLFKAPVIYVGAYFDNPQFFNQHSGCNEDLSLPEWCRVIQLEASQKVA